MDESPKITHDNKAEVSLPKEVRERLRPTSPTLRELYLVSGNRCAFVGVGEAHSCDEALFLKDGTLNCDVAHIYGVKEVTARGLHDLDNEQLREGKNLLLLCLKHHKIIDNPANEHKYTVERVQAMKRNHEETYREAWLPLARIRDITDGQKVKLPTNLGNIKNSDSTMFSESIEILDAFANRIAALAPGIREVLLLILHHGQVSPVYGSFTSSVIVRKTQIEHVAGIEPHDLAERAHHLKGERLLSIEDDEPWDIRFRLTSPETQENAWDIFEDLKVISDGSKDIARRALVDLDFSVFEYPKGS